MKAADIRLLVPALFAWTTAATLLGTNPAIRVGAAAVLLAAGVVLVRQQLSRPLRGGAHALYVPGGGVVGVALALVATSVVVGASGLQTWRREAGSMGSLAQRGAVVTLRATVATDPRQSAPRPDARQPVGGTTILQLAVRSVDGRGSRSSVSARVLVFGAASWSRLHRGERVEATGRLAPARRGDEVVATFAARGPPRLLERAPTADRVAERLRAGLRTASSGLPRDARGLLPGLVVGDTSQQPADLTEAMRSTGLTHLSAVSGTNTTLVALVALAIARAVGLGRRTRLVFAVVVLAGFVVLARPEPSVLRAAVMGGLGLLAFGTARQRAALPVLAATVVGLLVLDPWLARSYGFALSVLATLGLLLLAQPCSDALSRRMPRWLAASIAVPLAAQAFVGPVVVLLSGQVSLVAIAANMFAEPAVAPATVLGLAAALVSPLSPWLAAVVAQVAGLFCSAIAVVARALAAVPGGQLGWPGGGRGALLLAVATLVLLVGIPRLLRIGRTRPGLAAVVAVAALAPVAAATAPLPRSGSWPPPGWVLVACDVGQGDALVLRTSPGRAVLIDAGPAPDDVDRCLSELGVRTLDLVVLTHFDSDHVVGFPGVLRGRSVRQVVVTIIDEPAVQARDLRRQAAAAGIPVRTMVDGERGGAGSVSWQVLGPQRVVRDGSVSNNASIVLLVRAGGLRLLLLGDVETPAARLVSLRMAAIADGPRVDVLKVAHHGSALQDPGLIAGVRARLALVSVGAGNPYGHPTAGTLRLLAAQGATVARTDLQGDLAVINRGGALSLINTGAHQRAVGARR